MEKLELPLSQKVYEANNGVQAVGGFRNEADHIHGDFTAEQLAAFLLGRTTLERPTKNQPESFLQKLKGIIRIVRGRSFVPNLDRDI